MKTVWEAIGGGGSRLGLACPSPDWRSVSRRAMPRASCRGGGRLSLGVITLVWMLGISQGANPEVRAVKPTFWGVRRPLVEEFAGCFWERLDGKRCLLCGAPL